MAKDERHAFGAHFTHPNDIMKIVGPTIVEPWREQVESARTLKRLAQLRDRLHHFKVLDPACGSGNFLYIAYRELKRIEARIIERINNEFTSRAEPAQQQMSYLSASNFYGLDILPFAVEIAKVTMMIGRKMAIDELHISEAPLPLDNLDDNFIACDSLVDDAGAQRQWPEVDVIIGNPPFLGAKRLKPERGPDYVNAVRSAYPDVPGMADYCVYWFRKAHDHLRSCAADDLVSGRAGLVGTQNIRNNQSRVGGLDHIVGDGTIIEAVENQPWSGDANVHVSIANWVKTHDTSLLPKKRLLWSKVTAKQKSRRKPGEGSVCKEYELTYRECDHISSSLSDQTDVTDARTIPCNTSPQRVFQGITTGHSGFVLSPSERKALVESDPRSAEVIAPYLIGRELVSGNGLPKRFVVSFQNWTILEARQYEKAFQRIESRVLSDVQQKADEEHETESARKQHLQRWWLHWRPRTEMCQAIQNCAGRYIAASRTQHWPFVFAFMSNSILPGDKIQVFAFDDDYSFGVLQSCAHVAWYRAKTARLKNELDHNYSSESVFDTFPWPQTPTDKAIREVASASRDVRRLRTESLKHLRGGLRALYSTLGLPGANPLKKAHAALDAAVMSAYGFSSKKDLLSQLLLLNKRIVDHADTGTFTTGPGIPTSYATPTDLVTTDCITTSS